MILKTTLPIESKVPDQLHQLERASKLAVKPNWENIFSVGVFIATVAFFTVAATLSSISNQSSISENENRALAPFPKLHTMKKDLPKFAQGFEKFYNDRFAFRLPLVASRNFVLMEALNSSGHHEVAIGKDKWLYYVAPQGISPQANLEPLSETSLVTWGRAIQERKNFLAEHGIKYVFVIPPEKGAIFPENLPDRIKVKPGKTRLDQLQDYLRAHTDVDFVDAKALLQGAKNGPNSIYHKPDTHWNQWGAFLVSQALFKHIHAYFPAVEPFTTSDYSVTTEYPFRGDLGRMLGLADWFAERTMCVTMTHEKGHPQNDAKIAAVPDTWVPSFGWINPDATLPRVFVMRDSFCGYLIPFIAEKASFSEFHWNHKMFAPLLLPQKPDLVIDEMAERHLYDYEPENAPHFKINTTSEKGGTVIANFEKTFELKNVDVQQKGSTTVIKLQWRTLSEQLLNRRIGLNLMSGASKILAQKDYEQDAFQRTVPAFSEWTDTIELPHTSGLPVTDLALYVHNQAGACMSSNGKKTDWETTRVWLNLKDLQKQ